MCEKTIYNYIEIGLFKDWDVTNLTLKRKVKRRIPKKNNTLKKRKEIVSYEGRTYTDYLEYKVQNPNVPTIEMDTVYNNPIRAIYSDFYIRKHSVYDWNIA